MTIRKTLFAAITSLGMAAVAGCVGGIEPTTGDPGGPGQPSDPGTPGDPGPGDPVATDAKAQYVSDVDPIMQKCGGPACHAIDGASSPLFVVAGDAEQTYQAIISYNSMVGTFDKTTARMLTYVQEGGGHVSYAYTADEATKVGGWLDAELAIRDSGTGTGDGTGTGGDTGGTGPGAISKQLKEEWSGCMDLGEWQQLQVAEEWANKGSTTGICRACHDNGGEGAIYSENSEFVFNLVTQNEVYMLSYFKPQIVDPLDPAAEPKMVINYTRFDAVRNAEFPHVNHGRFNLNENDEAVQALEQFYANTMARKAAGQCGPPRLLPPTQ